jgi:hypothetical protein
MGTGLGSRIERRWASLLGPGTWPEVLRRYILLSHRAAEEEEGAVQLVGDEVARCARELSRRAPEDLAPGQHLLLLEALCNEALGTVELRDALTRRLEEADEVLKDLRAARAEDRKQIREVEDALKDERKRKREEAAREAAAKAEAAAAAAAALTGGAEGGTNGAWLVNFVSITRNSIIIIESSRNDQLRPLDMLALKWTPPRPLHHFRQLADQARIMGRLGGHSIMDMAGILDVALTYASFAWKMYFWCSLHNIFY